MIDFEANEVLGRMRGVIKKESRTTTSQCGSFTVGRGCREYTASADSNSGSLIVDNMRKISSTHRVDT